MKGKLVLTAGILAGIILISVGIVDALNSWGTPLPFTIRLLPKPSDFQLMNLDYTYSVASNRHISANVTIRNNGIANTSGTIYIYFYDNTTATIASGTQPTGNVTIAETELIIVPLTWAIGMNLTNYADGVLIIIDGVKKG